MNLKLHTKSIQMPNLGFWPFMKKKGLKNWVRTAHAHVPLDFVCQLRSSVLRTLPVLALFAQLLFDK